MATRIYQEGNFTFEHHQRGNGDSSCLLHDLTEFDEFDVAIIQGSMAWYGGILQMMNSSSSPYDWLQKVIPLVYRDAMDALLTEASRRTKTVFVLGKIGTNCTGKSGIIYRHYMVGILHLNFGTLL